MLQVLQQTPPVLKDTLPRYDRRIWAADEQSERRIWRGQALRGLPEGRVEVGGVGSAAVIFECEFVQVKITRSQLEKLKITSPESIRNRGG
jgi:hypothetical protein